jgi:hypothetical protein
VDTGAGNRLVGARRRLTRHERRRSFKLGVAYEGGEEGVTKDPLARLRPTTQIAGTQRHNKEYIEHPRTPYAEASLTAATGERAAWPVAGAWTGRAGDADYQYRSGVTLRLHKYPSGGQRIGENPNVRANGTLGGERFHCDPIVSRRYKNGDQHSVAIWFNDDSQSRRRRRWTSRYPSHTDRREGRQAKANDGDESLFWPGGGGRPINGLPREGQGRSTSTPINAQGRRGWASQAVCRRRPRDFKRREDGRGTWKAGAARCRSIDRRQTLDKTAFIPNFDFDVERACQDAAAGLSCGKSPYHAEYESTPHRSRCQSNPQEGSRGRR